MRRGYAHGFMDRLKRTALTTFHQERRAVFTRVAGYQMPLYHRSHLLDYRAARDRCMLADLGCFELVRINGARARAFLDRHSPQRLEGMPVGTVMRILLTSEDGAALSMPLAFFLDTFVLLMLDPEGIDPVLDLLADHVDFDVDVETFNDAFAPWALIGPECDAVFERLTRGEACAVEVGRVAVGSIYTARVIVASTRLYGEPAYLLLVGLGHVQMVLERLLDAGGDLLSPGGISALDMLRIEEGTPLSGQELTPNSLPHELGLMHMVDFDKRTFTGREAIHQAAAEAKGNWLSALVMHGHLIPRRNMQVFAGSKLVGYVTSGCYSPELECGVGMAMLDRRAAFKGSEVQIAAHGRRFAAEIVSRPIVLNRRTMGLHRHPNEEVAS